MVTFFEDALIFTWLASFFMKTHVKLMSSRRDIGLGDEAPWYHKIYRLVLPLVNKKSNIVIANSHKVKEYIISNENLADKKIEVIHNGIELIDVIKYDNYALQVNIVIIASLRPIKNHTFLFKTLKELNDFGYKDKYKLHVLGDGSLREYLEGLTQNMNLSENVLFYGSVENVNIYLEKMDIGVLCSDREGFSNALLEYMNFSLPVIATATGGNAELVDHTNGFLIPVGDINAMKNALKELIDNNYLRKKLGSASKTRIENNFSWQKSMQKWEHILQ